MNRHQLSERFPARQQKQPNPRITRSHLRYSGLTGKEASDRSSGFLKKNSTYLKDWRIMDKDVNTFYFTNFPEKCSMEDLDREFRTVGEVKDMFCPKKRDKAGNLFGFVRFSKKHNREKTLEELNKIWIGTYKLRAYLPKFNREPLRVRPKNQNTFPASSGRLGGFTSFAGVVSGRQVGTYPSTEDVSENKQVWENDVINFQSIESEKKWLDGVSTGFLKREFNWEEHGEELQEECAGKLSLTTLGGNLILIKSMTDKATRTILEEFDEWRGYWFEWTRQWTDIDVIQNREVWTRWYGVPLHAWSIRFFSYACAKFGLFIMVDESSEHKTRLDFARIKISTGFKNIDEVLNVRIDGKSFSIGVKEEACCFCDARVSSEVVSDDEDSQWSSEKQNSDGPADATIDDDALEDESTNSDAKQLLRTTTVIEEPHAELPREEDSVNEFLEVVVCPTLLEHQSLEVGPQENGPEHGPGIGSTKSPDLVGLGEADIEGNDSEDGPVICEERGCEKNGSFGPQNSLSMMGDISEDQLDGGPISEAQLDGEPITPTSIINLNDTVDGVNEIEECPNLAGKMHAQSLATDSGLVMGLSTDAIGDEEHQNNRPSTRGNCKRKSKVIEKKMEKEKWSTFVGEMISEDDREAARKDLRSFASQGFVCQGIEQKSEEAAKVWDFGKKIGIVSIDSDSEMAVKLFELHETERGIGGKAKETQIISS